MRSSRHRRAASAARHDGRLHVLAGRHGRRERPPGELDDLQGAHDATARCSGSMASAASGSSVAQPGAGRRCRLGGRLGLEPGPHRRGPWAGSRARRGPRARRGRTRRRGPDACPRPWMAAKSARDATLVGGDARLLRHVEHVELVVRYAASLGRAGPWRCRCPCRGRAGMASALTTSPPRRSARSSARSDLPVAVGADDGDDRGASSSARQVVRRGSWRQCRRWSWSSSWPNGSGSTPGSQAKPGLAPAAALDRLAGLPAPAVVEPVDVEEAVEVVVLVLHARGRTSRSPRTTARRRRRRTRSRVAASPRLRGKLSPGTDRQPSVSSCGSGSSRDALVEVT